MATSNPTSARPRTHATWHHEPAWLWLLSFIVCIGGDLLIGCWVLLPVYVACFYLGMMVISLFTYPMLERWRRRVARHGLTGWYVIEIALAPIWLNWTWRGPAWLQIVGGVVLAISVLIGVWAAGQMGWKRLLFVPALFPPGQGAEENDVPQRLVVVEAALRHEIRTLSQSRAALHPTLDAG